MGKIKVLITKSLDGCVERGSAAYNHLLWFMSQSSLFSMFSCFSLTRCQSSAVSPLSAELSESPELYQTARLTVNHMSAGKVPDTARRGALTLPVSQIQVMCSVFFSLDSTADLRSELQYFYRDFPQLTAWHSIYLIGYFIAIKLGNDFSIVILQMSCLKCCNSCDHLGNLGDSQKTVGDLPDSKTI